MMRRKHISLKTTIGLTALCILMLTSNAVTVHANAISNELKSTIDNVIEVVTDPAYSSNNNGQRQKLRDIINPMFNYQEMGKRALGKKDWLSRSNEERKEFIDLFGKLLENSYASKIESYQDETIEYGDEVVKGKYAMVKTKIIRKDDSINVDYKLINRGKDWRVYDFVIEDVSMIRNYRSQFSKIIRKDSFQVLLNKMSKKLGDLENGGKKNDDL